MISTRSAGLLIDTVVCLTLAKWETVSGRFGGYLTQTYKTMCRECGEIVQHRRGQANGHFAAPTIARADLVKSRLAGAKPEYADAGIPSPHPPRNPRPQLPPACAHDEKLSGLLAA